MLEKLKAKWRQALTFVVTLPGVIWLALRWPFMVVGLATIPVDNFLERRFSFPPTVSRFVGMGVFFGLLAISWWSLELVVLLATLALVTDIMLMASKVKARWQEA